jgi:mycofactocin precursor
MPQRSDTQSEQVGVDAGPEVGEPELIEDELVVEEISIDGMCGVY